MMFENNFTLVNEEGKETACELLFTFDAKSTGKSYIVYTDHTTDEWGYEKVFAYTYDPTGASTALTAIETDEEWEMGDRALELIQEGINDEAALDDDMLVAGCVS